jgi:hypothetical protein
MDTIPGQNCCITDFHLNFWFFLVSYYWHFRCHFSWDGSEFEWWVGSIAQFSQCFIVLSRLLFVLYLMYYKVSRKLICKLSEE